MQTTEFIWFNGKLVPWQDAKIHVLTHSLHYATGIFEGMRMYLTDRGPAIFRLAEHIQRLLYSANAISMKIPYTEQEIIEATKQLVAANKVQECYIRPIAYFGYGKMGVSPIGAPVELAIACWPWGAYLSNDPIDIQTSQYIRIPPNATVIDAKLSGHYLNSALAILKLQGTPYHEALLLDTNGNIVEGPAENFFIVKNQVIYTPKLGGILAGITRDSVIAIAKKLNFKLVETNITLAEAYEADEAFFTGTAAEVTPIKSIDDNIIGDGTKGPVTEQIGNQYQKVVHGQDPDFLHYLTFIQTNK